MRTEIDEAQQHHIYTCLKEGAKSFLKARKGNEALGLSTDAIDSELEVNKTLCRIFNPRAEEEAREDARRKKGDPTQMDIERDAIASSGETGGRVAGRIEPDPKVEDIPPTDTVIRDNLIACGLRVLLTDIRNWTSSERESVVVFARDYDRFEPNPAAIVPDALERIVISDVRMEQLVKAGPYKLKGFPLGADEPTSTLVYLPGTPGGDAELIQGEYVDSQEAEIKCALLNRGVSRDASMDPGIIPDWFAAGPWSAIGDEVKSDTIDIGRETRWYVLGPDAVKERVDTQTEAMLIAAIYNREAAGRDDVGGWMPVARRLEVSDGGLAASGTNADVGSNG